MGLISADSFNRTTGPPSLGTTDGAGYRDPLTWTNSGGTWKTNGTQAIPNGITGPNNSICTCDLTVSDVDITVLRPTPGTGEDGISFRVVDQANCWIFACSTSGNQAELVKFVAGVATSVTLSPGGFFTNGNTMRVVALGDSITVYRDSTLLGSTTDSFNDTATKHGLVTRSSTSGVWDNWSVSDPIIPFTPGGAYAGGTTPMEFTLQGIVE